MLGSLEAMPPGYESSMLICRLHVTGVAICGRLRVPLVACTVSLRAACRWARLSPPPSTVEARSGLVRTASEQSTPRATHCI